MIATALVAVKSFTSYASEFGDASLRTLGLLDVLGEEFEEAGK